jgi:hypothetical protein
MISALFFAIVSPELFYHLEVLGSDSWSCVGGAFVGVGSKGRNVGTIWPKIGARNDPMARWASRSEKYKFELKGQISNSTIFNCNKNVES